MSWTKIITLVVAVALITGGAIWAYRVFAAPESIDDITAKWSLSGHADTTSESFIHWDEDEPAVIPGSCAKCHSLYGYLDYLGADGSAVLEVNETAKTGSVLYCNTCHNETAHTLDKVVFPGGAEISGLGRWANCMRCHQGRTSTATVRGATEGLDVDEVSTELRFINVHYAIAAATRYGSEASVGYEYEGRDYVGWYPHTKDYDACTECHDAHSTQINPAMCEPCHSNVTNYSDLFDIRVDKVDYDGNGTIDEGILAEINTLHTTLYKAIQTYAAEVTGTPIVYANNFPYWGIDSNGNNEADPDEVSGANQYNAWTPRLLRAAYNYHYVLQDPGGFTHNPKYILQLLYDAVENLGDHEQVELDIANFVRPESTF